jgi:hypothetical protein
MNIVPHHVVRLVAICAFATVPLLAPASGSENSATFQLAMGPTSAAQKTNRATRHNLTTPWSSRVGTPSAATPSG